MNFKKYHVSRNLWNGTLVSGTISAQGIEGDSQGRVRASIFTELESGTYTLNASALSEIEVFVFVYNTSGTFVERIPIAWASLPYTFSLESRSKIKFVFAYAPATSMIAIQPSDISNIMLNTGSQPLPYEPYSSEVWHDTPHYIHNTSTDTITTLPAVIYPNATTATVGLKGQATQSGTPTPDSPIMPQGCGDKTANLFNEEYPNISGTIRYVPIYVGEGSFTLSTTTPYDSEVANLFLLSGNVSTGASTQGNGAWLNHNVTAQSDGGYITIAYRHYTSTTSPADCKTMLNTGSTALPYEPFGVKIPISSGGVTTTEYLGEVESTRQIRKLVFDGTENFTLASTDTNRTVCQLPLRGCKGNYGFCTHILWKSSYESSEYNRLVWTTTSGGTLFISLSNECLESQTVADFKTYLQQQYAAGTPVVVWYVLATPTTGIINEPLMRIGDYADTLSNVSIPVTAGGDTLSVGTTVQPSEVTVNYKGWHPVQNVHERDNGAWT